MHFKASNWCHPYTLLVIFPMFGIAINCPSLHVSERTLKRRQTALWLLSFVVGALCDDAVHLSVCLFVRLFVCHMKHGCIMVTCQGNVRDLLKIREKILSGKSCLKRFIVSCIFVSIQVFSRSLFCVKYEICDFGSCTVAFLPPPLTVTVVLAWYE